MKREPKGGDGLRERLRVMAFMDTAMLSGPAKQLLATVEPLAITGVDIIPVTFGHRTIGATEFIAELRDRRIEHRTIAPASRLELVRKDVVMQVSRELDASIVQTHSYRPAVLAMCAKIRGLRKPWIGFFHGATHEDWKVRVYNFIDNLALRSASRVVVVAHSQRKRFVGKRDVRVVPNAVLPFPEVGDEFRIPASTAKAILYAGRLSHEKGVDVLLRAFATLSDLGDCKLYVAGDGPMQAELRQLAGDLGIAERVSFLGRVKLAEKSYRGADLLVLPSRSEGMPNVLLEAAAADTPMVSTDVGDVSMILAEGEAGTLVRPDNVNDLSSAIAHALRTGRTTAGHEARSRIAQRFSLRRRVETLTQLYRSVTLDPTLRSPEWRS